jgi:ArsR family transcriptional regulator, arsenate/arsenite/antimonite-responsive transcriptional repressor
MKRIAQFFNVLADETRLKILWLLHNSDELCVCDIIACLEITQSKASRHLGVMRHAGLVNDRKAGLWSYYTLVRTGDLSLLKHINLFFASLSQDPEAIGLLEKLQTMLECSSLKCKCIRVPIEGEPK